MTRDIFKYGQHYTTKDYWGPNFKRKQTKNLKHNTSREIYDFWDPQKQTVLWLETKLLAENSIRWLRI